MTDLRYVFAFTAARAAVAAFYRDVIGLDVEEAKDESGWSLPATGTGDAWDRVQEELRARNLAFASAVGSMSPAELEAPWAPGRAPRWQVAYGLMNHTSHHTAEVLIARQLLGITFRE